MSLTNEMLKCLEKSIKEYSFPSVIYDFNKNQEIRCDNMLNVEGVINSLLRSKNIIDLKDGLANVIYWGYAQIPYRDNRVNRFRNKIKDENLESFSELASSNKLSIRSINRLKLPEFSGISFISKILMFYDPKHCCVLDHQIAKIRTTVDSRALNELTYTIAETQIRPTKKNENVYFSWCKECLSISTRYFSSAYRTVDIERGFFNLIQKDCIHTARDIYNSF